MIEKVPHENDHSQEIIEFIEANEQLADPATRRDFFENMDDNGFIDTLQQVASLIRTGDLDQQHFDGDKVMLMAHDVPDQREKEQLLRDTWGTAQKFLHDRDLSDEEALEYAALTAAGGFLYTHPFSDGNGRTSRVLSYMMIKGNADPDELKNIVTQSNSKEWFVTPKDIGEPMYVKLEEGLPDKIKWSDDVFAGEEEDALDGRIASSFYKNYIINTFLNESGEIPRSIADQCSVLDDDGSKVLDGEKFIEVLVSMPEGGVSYADELLKLRRRAEAEYVHRFLKAMENPTPMERRIIKANMLNPDNGPEFMRDINGRAAREFGRVATADGKVTPRDEMRVFHRVYSGVRHRQQE